MGQSMKIKRDDQVVVLTGKYKGKKGSVLKAFPKEQKVVVSGVNVAKRHQKPGQDGVGGIVEKELPIHVSNVGIIDPKEDKASRVGYKIEKDGTKLRVSRRSGELLD